MPRLIPCKSLRIKSNDTRTIRPGPLQNRISSPFYKKFCAPAITAVEPRRLTATGVSDSYTFTISVTQPIWRDRRLHPKGR